MLQKITQTNCPECGCVDISSESRAIPFFARSSSRKPTDYEEGREFKCGYRYNYSTTYHRVKATNYCTKNEKFLTSLVKRKRFVEMFKELVNKSDLDSGYQEWIKNRIEDEIKRYIDTPFSAKKK